MRRLTTLLTVLLVLGLLGLVVLHTRYDLETTEINGQPVTVRLDRWNGSVAAIGPEGSAVSLSAIPLLGAQAGALTRELQELMEDEGGEELRATARSYEQLNSDFLEQVAQVRRLLQSYRTDASNALGSFGGEGGRRGDSL